MSNFESFLKTGTTFTAFSSEEKTAVMKERLTKSANCFKISFFKKEGTLFGPKALLELIEDKMLAISSLSVCCRNIVLYYHLKSLRYFAPIVTAIEAE